MGGRSSYWIEFDEGGNWKQTGTCTCDVRLVFLTRLASLSPTLYIVTHSFCITPTMYELSVHRHYPPIQRVHVRADARATHAHTDAYDQHIQVPPPTAVHPIASRFLSRAVYILTFLSIYRRLSRSLLLSLSLWDSRTHLPIISQSS